MNWPSNPAGTRTTAKMRALLGHVPPPRRELDLTAFTFWDGSPVPGGVPFAAFPAFRVLDDVFERHKYRLNRSADEWCYARRLTRGGVAWSLHSWGWAVDVNATTNPMRAPLTTDMTPAMITDVLALRHGTLPVWVWGGLWSTPDPMHFQINLSPKEVASMATPTVRYTPSDVQARVNRLGYQPALKVDGDLGPVSVKAIMAVLDWLEYTAQQEQGRAAAAEARADAAEAALEKAGKVAVVETADARLGAAFRAAVKAAQS